MGFVTQIFIKPSKAALVQLPTGSFQADQSGHLVISTLPASFTTALAESIGAEVAKTFVAGERAQLALAHLTIEYSVLKLQARKMRHGFMIFLAPKTLGASLETCPQPHAAA